MDKERKMKRIVFRIQNKSKHMRKDSRKDTGRSSVLEAMTSGKVGYSFEHEGKWDSMASQMVERLKETSDPVFKGASASSLGILRRKTHRDTIHVNADAPTRALISNDPLSKSAQYLRSSLKLVESSVEGQMRMSGLWKSSHQKKMEKY